MLRIFWLLQACLSSFVLASNSAVFSSTLEDCDAIMRLSDCTACFNNVKSLSYTFTDGNFPYAKNVADGIANEKTYEMVTCDFPGLCPDGVVRSSCAWKRILGMACVDPKLYPGSG